MIKNVLKGESILVSEQQKPVFELQSHKERAILVGFCRNPNERWLLDDYMDELALLADTAGAEVLERIVQIRPVIDPAYFIGRGKVEVLQQLAEELQADIIIFDDDLSPAQVKNIAKICPQKIIDRSGLILDIFARRAKTREARTQVELAQLQYLLPRLTRAWEHLSRQVGGAGIGLRGPGETQLETDRRLIRKRIDKLQAALEKIRQQRRIQRSHRDKIAKVALVGYTNAGKSTLFNALTQSQVFVEDRLFATLDSTVRALRLAKAEPILLIDTVGFIRKLPHHLVASFKSTLDEITEADLLLHVVDVTQPHFHEQMNVVDKVLEDLGANEKPTLIIFNKIDRLQETGLLARLKTEFDPCLAISASRGIFVDEVETEITRFLNRDFFDSQVRIQIDQSKSLAKLYEISQVLRVTYNDGVADVLLRTNRLGWERIRRLPGIEWMNDRLDEVAVSGTER